MPPYRSQPLGLTNGKSKEGARGELRKEKNYRRKKKPGKKKIPTHPFPLPNISQPGFATDYCA